MGDSHGHVTSAAGRNKKSLAIVFGLTIFYLIVVVVGGLWTGSLALLADAGHMLTDVAGLALALLAIWFAEKPATPERTYGYYRVEILAALTNAIVLILISLYILYEAYQRFSQPPEIQSMGMMIVAVIGLIINLISMKILFSSSQESLNVKGAYLEVLSDAVGSIGVIIGAAVIYFTGWMWVDTVIAVLIGFWVLPRTWILLKQSINILLEGVPDEIDIEKLRNDLLAVKGVESIHQLKVWAITSKNVHLTVHLFAPHADRNALYQDAMEMLSHEHGITEMTLQIEDDECMAHAHSTTGHAADEHDHHDHDHDHDSHEHNEKNHSH